MQIHWTSAQFIHYKSVFFLLFVVSLCQRKIYMLYCLFFFGFVRSNQNFIQKLIPAIPTNSHRTSQFENLIVLYSFTTLSVYNIPRLSELFGFFLYVWGMNLPSYSYINLLCLFFCPLFCFISMLRARSQQYLNYCIKAGTSACTARVLFDYFCERFCLVTLCKGGTEANYQVQIKITFLQLDT